jgi:hypothetical protein
MFGKFYVAYDLVYATREQYATLDAELKRLGAIEVLKSDWYLSFSGAATGLRDHLKKYIHPSDRLVVLNVADWASYDAMADMNRV